MKKRFPILLVIVCLLALLAVIPAAAEAVPSAKVAGHNLLLEDSVHIIYYADFENLPAEAESGILVWKTPQKSYVWGNEDEKLSSVGTEYGHAKFIFRGVAAKMMTQDIYALPYIKLGQEVIYGALDKYSVLQYAYNKSGSTTMLGGRITLGELLVSLLDYGTAAQQYFGYKQDRLANATYYQISVVGGILPDGTQKGLFQPDEHATMTAFIENFDHWENADGVQVGTDAALDVTVSKEERYTATDQPYDPQYSKGLEFVSNGDGTCYVAGIGSCTDVDLRIPPVSPAGERVTGVGEGALKWLDFIESLTFEGFQSVTLGEHAFWSCDALESVTFGDGCQNVTLCEVAFRGCGALTDIRFGDGCQSVTIGGHAFWFCQALTDVRFGEGTESIWIGECAFRDCDSLTKLEIPAGVKAFEYGGGWTPEHLYCIVNRSDLPITDSAIAVHAVVMIDKNGNLTYAPDASDYFATDDGFLFHIEEGNYTLIAYFGNEKTVTLPTAVNGHAYSVCELRGVQNVVISKGFTRIDSHAFDDCYSLKSVVIPEGVTTINSFAFSGCRSLKSIVIPASVTQIGDAALMNCGRLTIAVAPGNNTYHVSGNCLLTTETGRLIAVGRDYQLPTDGSLKIIGQALYLSTDREGFALPESVTTLEACALYAYYHTLVIPQTVLSIDGGAAKIDGVTYYPRNRWLALAEGNPVYSSVNNCIVERATGKLIVGGQTDGNLANDGSITSIGAYAFYDNYISELTIPDSVTRIEEGAFYECGMSSVTFGEQSQLTSIGAYAFYECGVSSVTFGKQSQLKSIGAYAFYHNHISELAIPDSVTRIEEGAFCYCNIRSIVFGEQSQLQFLGARAFADNHLTRITLGNRLKHIGKEVFCDGGWRNFEITFRGTEKEWLAIEKVAGWNVGLGEYTIVFLGDEEEEESNFAKRNDALLNDKLDLGEFSVQKMMGD